MSPPTPCMEVWTTASARGVSGSSDGRRPRRGRHDDLLVEGRSSRRPRGRPRRRIRRRRCRRRSPVGGRHDLAPVAEVDLVAVVARRVVAGGDHDAGVGAEVADGEGEEGRRQGARQQQSAAAGRGHHGRGVAGEDVGVVARVEADDDLGAGRGAGVPLGTRLQVRDEPGGRANDDGPVHPVRPGAQDAAQAGGAELEHPREAVGQVVGGLGARFAGPSGLDHAGQLGAGGRVRIVGQPGLRPRDQFGRGHVGRHLGGLRGATGRLVSPGMGARIPRAIAVAREDGFEERDKRRMCVGDRTGFEVELAAQRAVLAGPRGRRRRQRGGPRVARAPRERCGSRVDERIGFERMERGHPDHVGEVLRPGVLGLPRHGVCVELLRVLLGDRVDGIGGTLVTEHLHDGVARVLLESADDRVVCADVHVEANQLLAGKPGNHHVAATAARRAGEHPGGARELECEQVGEVEPHGDHQHLGRLVDGCFDREIHILRGARRSRVSNLVGVTTLEDPRAPAGRLQQALEEAIDRDDHVHATRRFRPTDPVGHGSHPGEHRSPLPDQPSPFVRHR